MVVAACGALLLVTAGPAEAGSVKRVNYRSAADDPAKADFTFFDHGSLTMTGNCAAGELVVTVATEVDGAMIHASSLADDPANTPDLDAYREDDVWDQNEFFDLVDQFPEDSDSGHVIYARPDGKVVTVDWASETSANSDSPYGGTESKDCVFIGTARVLESGHADRINYRADANDPPKTIERGGLKLNASCDENGDLQVEADSKYDDAMINWNHQYGPSNGAIAYYWPNLDTNAPQEIFFRGSVDGDSSASAFTFARPGGTNMSAVFAGEDSDDGDEAFGVDCALVGTLRVRGSGDDKRVNARISGDQDTAAQFFQQGGLRLSATCDLDATFPMQVFPGVTTDHSMLHANTQSLAQGASYGEDDDFLISENGTRGLFQNVDFLSHEASEESGQLIFSKPDGTYTTINWASHAIVPLGGTKDCVFVGVAEQSKP